MISMETISNQHKFAGNPRKMSAKEKTQLKKHLETLGDLSGVIFDVNSKSFVGGNQRSDIFDGAPIEITERFDEPTKNKTVAHGFILYNGEKFAYREVAFTESEFREACIVANNDGGEFDLEILSGWDEIELEDWGFDVSVFEDMEPEPTEGLTGDDEIPEPEEPICKTGDLWQLGRHRLLCGDATKKEDVERLMDGNKADMVFTDPPYGMNLDTDYTTMGAKSQKHKKVIGDDKPFVWFDIGAKEQFWFGADYYIETIQRDYDNLGSWFVWDKYPTDQNDKRFGSAFELIWSKQNHQRKIIRIGSLNVGHHKREAIVHPTQKPSDLICKFLEDYSTAGQIIWDGFLGSGSTLIACEKTNRKCYGMEIDPHYCDVIIKRWEDYTGEKAVKL